MKRRKQQQLGAEIAEKEMSEFYAVRRIKEKEKRTEWLLLDDKGRKKKC
jgi:hypothetical protein